MTDTMDKEARSRTMAKVKSKNTGPEMAVRRLLHRAGHRYRLHRPDLPGKPDLVFPKHRLALFIHGCFWHRHGCKRSTTPKSNAEYWAEKFRRNKERDHENREALEGLGWKHRVIWECEAQTGAKRISEEMLNLESS